MFAAVLWCHRQHSKSVDMAVASRTLFTNAGGRQPAAGGGPGALCSVCLCYSVSCCDGEAQGDTGLVFNRWVRSNSRNRWEKPDRSCIFILRLKAAALWHVYFEHFSA